MLDDITHAPRGARPQDVPGDQTSKPIPRMNFRARGNQRSASVEVKPHAEACFRQWPAFELASHRIVLVFKPFKRELDPTKFRAEKSGSGPNGCAAAGLRSDVILDGGQSNGAINPVRFAEDWPHLFWGKSNLESVLTLDDGRHRGEDTPGRVGFKSDSGWPLLFPGNNYFWRTAVLCLSRALDLAYLYL